MRHAGLVEHHKNGKLISRGTFLGSDVGLDEALHPSEHGRDVGLGVGAALGALLGPLGFAEGVVWGPTLGAVFGKPNEVDREPRVLAERLRAAGPPSNSAIVLIADAQCADELLTVADRRFATVIRRTLAPSDLGALEASLSTWPAASPGPSTEGEQALEETANHSPWSAGREADTT